MVLAVQLPPQEHICPHCKAATRRVKGCYTRLIKHSPLLIKSCISRIARGAIDAAVVTQLTSRAPLPLRISKPLPRFNESCSRSCVNTFFPRSGQTMPCQHQSGLRVFNEVHIPRPSHLPRVLSIDECKGNAAGQKYQVIITDSEAKRIMVILPARTTTALAPVFLSIPI